MSTKNLWDASVGEEMPRVVSSSSDAKERHRRPCTLEDIGCLLAISGRCLLAISGRSETDVL